MMGRGTEEEAPSLFLLCSIPHHPGCVWGGGAGCALCIPGLSGCVSDFVNMFRRKQKGLNSPVAGLQGSRKLALL